MMTYHSTEAVFGKRSTMFRAIGAALGVLAAWLVTSADALSSRAMAQEEVMQLRVVAPQTPVHPGDRVGIAVVMEFVDGWHAWPNKPVPPAELGDDFAAIPTLLKFSGDVPAEWGVHLDFTQWPTPHAVSTAGLTGTPVQILSYSGRSVAFVPVTIGENAKTGDVTLKFEVSYQACNDSVCQQPTSTTAEVKLTVAAMGAAGAESKPVEPALFKDFDGSVFAKIAAGDGTRNTGSRVPESKTSESNGTDTANAVAGSTNATPATPSNAAIPPNLFGFPLPSPSSAVGVIVLFIVSVIGGVLLNLTPCVLPVIPIKVMTLTQHAGGSRSKALALGAWMALGVLAFWVAIGIPMAFFSSALDPSRIIFGTWWVTFIIGLVIVAMGLGIMGLFTINLPQSVYMVNPKADSAWGSFVFGLMTAVLGLPCFGFVAGGLLAGAATLPPLVIMVIFAGIGAGMAGPYLALSAYPKLVDRIPRTGPASELIKQVMGLLLLAAAAFFVGAGLKTLLSGKPYLKEAIVWWGVAFFVLVAGIWLTLRILQIAKKSWPKVVMPVIAVLAVWVSYAFADGLTTTAKQDYLAQKTVSSRDDALVPGTWMHWTAARWEKAKSSDKVILLDFTADWCINCKFLKRTVLDRDPVLTELKDVIKFEVDLSASDSPGWKFLSEFGRTAVPTLIVLKSGGVEPNIMNAYTPDNVMIALKSAKSDLASAKNVK